ncbi:hypothetical protein [Massilia sp. H6]|uniref:hypothetical protein n=1 Tax=Massilia sp. H6 TaxID=2970464 RepID=UPI002169F87E|nr:hypothetical protein [Massilia sp. H6]UVW28736.1 hypothetical protein NRS07_00865 [Massilia sp. H6]
MRQQVLGALALLALACAGSAQAQLLRDPFARPAPPADIEAGAAPEPEVAPQLRAIVYAPGRSLANIGGRILAAGDWFGDYRLLDIQERSVTLVRRGVKQVLRLDQASVK